MCVCVCVFEMCVFCAFIERCHELAVVFPGPRHCVRHRGPPHQQEQRGEEEEGGSGQRRLRANAVTARHDMVFTLTARQPFL